MKVIVGLGNPGAEYEDTRHNAGFKVMDRLATKCGADWKLDKHLYSVIVKSKLAGQDVVLLQPLTYMNDSGKAVVAVLQWFKLTMSDLLIVHDDVSLPPGRLRFQKAGGAGGQHGVESIIEYFGGKRDFDRLKIGVGPDPGGDIRAAYLLARISAEETKLYQEIFDLGAKAVLNWLEKGIDESMNRFNGSSDPVEGLRSLFNLDND